MKYLFFLILTGAIFASCTSESSNSVESSDKLGNKIGDVAPNIVYPSPDGDSIALYDLRGTMVLIDFWAAWCPPCRMENPNLVETYHEFKDKEFRNAEGFTIYSVSLDQNKNDWVKAIRDDQLEWDHHVSDLKGWQSVPAAMYQVTGIPMNFLVDGDGVIVARNLRGEALGESLKNFLQ